MRLSRSQECGGNEFDPGDVPMTIEAGHFKRKTPWNAAPGFRQPWEEQFGDLQPFVRSMSGWTREKFGEPDRQWLEARQ